MLWAELGGGEGQLLGCILLNTCMMLWGRDGESRSGCHCELILEGVRHGLNFEYLEWRVKSCFNMGVTHRRMIKSSYPTYYLIG